MSKNFFVSIGLEIHVALNVSGKVFSPEKVGESSWISLGFPGVLPLINLKAVEQTLRLSSACNCKINYENIVFDRKNYFYYDLPKGYQITQHFHPIGKNGYLQLPNGKKISIKQIHLEEDSAQQIKSGHEIKLSFGRLGRAIVEIVTAPDFESYEEVELFIRKLRRICSFLKISNVSYENGEIRIDLNVSVRKNKNDPLSSKSEVKNLNSLFALRKSLEWLLQEKLKEIDSDHKETENHTYCWVEKLKKCEIMRKKGSVSDYFYIPETNIPRIFLTKDQYRKISYESRIDLAGIQEQLISSGLKKEESEYLMDNHHLFNLVKRLDDKLKDLRSSYNWVVNVISGMCDDFQGLFVDEIEKVIVDAEVTKKINTRIAKDLLKEIIQNKSTYKFASRSLKVSPIFNLDVIKKMVMDAFTTYEKQIPNLLGNLPKLERLIIGECMKNSRGQVDPIKTKEFFEEVLKNYQDNNN